MLKYLILFGFIFLCFGCGAYKSVSIYQEETKNYTVKIKQVFGTSYHIHIFERIHKEKTSYYFNFHCNDMAMIYRNKSQGSFAPVYFVGEIFYSITDTNGGYFSFGTKVASKSNQIVFQPLTENQKRWLKIASEETTFDSCRYYDPSQIIGFIPAPKERL